MNKQDQALVIIKTLNPNRNDFDAYLFEIAEWGLGLRETKPDPKDFGLKVASAAGIAWIVK